MTARQILGGFILYLSSSLCASGGVGGGTLNVPILYYIFGYSFHESVILSLCTLAGNYLIQTFINIVRKHPKDKGRLLIYWDAILVLLPAELGGSNIGVILSGVFADSFMLLLAILLLTFVLPVTYYKAQSVWDHETTVLEALNDSRLGRNNNSSSQLSPLVEVPSDNNLASQDREANEDIELLGKPKSSVAIPWLTISVIVIFIIFYVILYVVENSYNVCSWKYAVTISSIYPIIIAEIVWGYLYLMKQQNDEPSKVLFGDINWKEISFLAPILAFGIGVITSLLGIGGGELMGPMLYMLGVLPLVTSATIALMSLVNTSSSIIHYMFLNDVDYSTASILFVIGAAGGFTGRAAAIYVAKQYGRPSVMIFAICVVIIISLCLYAYDLSTDNDSWEFTSLCN